MSHRGVLEAEANMSATSTALRYKQRIVGAVEAVLAVKVLGGAQGHSCLLPAACLQVTSSCMCVCARAV